MDIFKNRTFLLSIVAVFFAGGVWYVYFGSSSQSGGTQPLATVETPTGTAGQSLIVALSNLQTVKIDPKLFTDPVFVSLTDFGVTIAPQAVGRTNPFAPLSGVGSAASVVLPCSITGGK